MLQVASLDSPVAKISRAIEHYIALKENFNDGRDFNLLPVDIAASSDGRVFDFNCREIKPLDPRFPSVLGDGFYNLRCALDHLVYQLHISELGSHLSRSIEKYSAFPVMDFEPTDKKGQPVLSSDWRGVKNLNASTRAVIDNLQPFHGWSDSDIYPRPAISEMRQVLHEVNWFNLRDKHREIHLVYPVASHVWEPSPSLLKFGVTTSPAFGVPLSSNALVDRWIFESPPDEEITSQGVYSAVIVEISPDDRVNVVQSLGACILGVTAVIQLFEDRFPSCRMPDLSRVRMTKN